MSKASEYMSMVADETPRFRKFYPYVGKGTKSSSLGDFVKKNQSALQGQNGAVRHHSDGSICKAQSPDTCPFNKKVEAGEKDISGDGKKAIKKGSTFRIKGKRYFSPDEYETVEKISGDKVGYRMLDVTTYGDEPPRYEYNEIPLNKIELYNPQK